MATNYTMTAKDCLQGDPRYWGIQIEEETGIEHWSLISPEEYLSYGGVLGCPVNKGLVGNGVWSFHYPFKSEADVKAQLLKQLAGLKASQKQQTAFLQLLPLRSTMLMVLRNADIPVADPNNLLDIYYKYNAALNLTKDFNPAVLANLQTNANVTKSFDFLGLFSGLVGIVDNIITGVNAADTQQYLQNWTQLFLGWMHDDFNGINEQLTQHGPQAALDYLRNLKNNNWANMRNYITNYCSQHQVEVPGVIKDWWQQQQDMENNLIAQVAANANNNNNPPGNNPPGNNPPGKTKMPFWQIALIILAVVIVLGGGITAIVYVAKRGKKSRKAA